MKPVQSTRAGQKTVTPHERDTLSFEDLAVHYHTGRSVVISGKGRERVTAFQAGVMTKVGDMELSEWAERMKELIQQEGEQDLFDALHEWVSEYPFLHRQEDVELYALELYSRRIFDNPLWVDYQDFKEKYHRDVSIITVKRQIRR